MGHSVMAARLLHVELLDVELLEPTLCRYLGRTLPDGSL
jgi:hypothetical protein